MWFRRTVDRSHRARIFRSLYNADRFREAMNRERARADRWGLPLALLSFGASSTDSERQTLVQVAKRLQQRMRATDEAGWLDFDNIGILMPNTPGWAHGPWRMTSVRHLQRECPGQNAAFIAILQTGSAMATDGGARCPKF